MTEEEKSILGDLYQVALECESWMRCLCGHPYCKKCAATKEASEVFVRVEKLLQSLK